jgi:hypothetical protein
MVHSRTYVPVVSFATALCVERAAAKETSVPEVRQYYGLVLLSFQSRTTWVRGALVICALNFLLVPFDLSKPKLFKIIIESEYVQV